MMMKQINQIGRKRLQLDVLQRIKKFTVRSTVEKACVLKRYIAQTPHTQVGAPPIFEPKNISTFQKLKKSS